MVFKIASHRFFFLKINNRCCFHLQHLSHTLYFHCYRKYQIIPSGLFRLNTFWEQSDRRSLQIILSWEAVTSQSYFLQSSCIQPLLITSTYFIFVNQHKHSPVLLDRITFKHFKLGVSPLWPRGRPDFVTAHSVKPSHVMSRQ